jgi:hypothetical protein
MSNKEGCGPTVEANPTVKINNKSIFLEVQINVFSWKATTEAPELYERAAGASPKVVCTEANSFTSNFFGVFFSDRQRKETRDVNDVKDRSLSRATTKRYR